ncbi:class I SAM-dependent methyltransferase [Kitasatospora sp. NPDC101183]|uniref:class I SAM-dependent methyltransferase n=1 Tax=Kitasatospora sp. NPDC101183 TaxID=3364100 RepID=UPI0037F81773
MPIVHENNQVELVLDDYNRLYLGESIDGLDLAFAPWDIGDVQQCVKALHEGGHVTGPVLDAGCGSGQNSVFLAQQGYQVTSFDFSPVAIEAAAALARKHDLPDDNPRFVVADATALDLPGRFATVIDSALYHCLTLEERRAYLAGLRRLALPTGRLLITCFADTAPAGMPGPFRISQEELHRELPRAGWAISHIEPGTYETRYVPQKVQQLAEQAGGPDLDVAGVPLTDRGNVLLPAWRVTAHVDADFVQQ